MLLDGPGARPLVGSLTRAASQRRGRLLGLAALALLAVVISASVGSYPVDPRDALLVLLSVLGCPVDVQDTSATAVLLGARWPRVLLGALVGSSLGVAGAILQGIFKNPLADPGLCGVSGGAALGAVAALVLGNHLRGLVSQAISSQMVTLAAFGGGLLAVGAVASLATSEGRTAILGLLLGGVAVSALCGAATGWLTFIATDAQLRSITFWSLGSLGGATWRGLFAALPLFLAPLALAAVLAAPLDAFLLGEAEAIHLGVSVERTKRLALIASALAVGTSVALCGAIGFIGLVAPHLARLLVGALHRFVLPASALIGVVLILFADLTARCVVAPAELPLGVVTATLGAPVFLTLLRGTLRGGS